MIKLKYLFAFVLFLIIGVAKAGFATGLAVGMAISQSNNDDENARNSVDSNPIVGASAFCVCHNPQSIGCRVTTEKHLFTSSVTELIPYEKWCNEEIKQTLCIKSLVYNNYYEQTTVYMGKC